MSMRIENTADGSSVTSARSSAAKGAASDARLGALSGGVSESDSVDLSDASNLVALAKKISQGDRAAKLASLSAQLRSGQPLWDGAQISRALIQTHLAQS